MALLAVSTCCNGTAKRCWCSNGAARGAVGAVPSAPSCLQPPPPVGNTCETETHAGALNRVAVKPGIHTSLKRLQNANIRARKRNPQEEFEDSCGIQIHFAMFLGRPTGEFET